MMRLALFLAVAFPLVACDFPPVPRGAGSGIEEGAWLSPIPGPETAPLYAIGSQVETAEPQRLGEPRELRGTLVGNAISSYVIEAEGGGWVTVQITPQTRLRIGDQVAGLREIQPGSEVRASYLPTLNGRYDLALEVIAEPGSVGWEGGRDARRRAADAGAPSGE